MVDGLFNIEEAKIIKSIPLSQEVAEDILFWPYSCDGRYSCKTGYRFLKEEEEEEELNVEPREVTNEDKQVWREIWSMKVPPMVKTLLWRACREAMPTKSALFRRKYHQTLSVSDAKLQPRLHCTPCGFAQNLIQCG